ncbi:MAG: hypothetical protein ACQEVA_23725, partial [Myxococcota bacterium]
PIEELETVTHDEMVTFVDEVLRVLREESLARLTVGAAAWKWRLLWTERDLDYYQFHMYEWINDYWSYEHPADYWGLDRPIVMGEFFFSGMTGISYTDMVSAWFDNGFAGALAWQFETATDAELDEMKAFADAHPCKTTYGETAVMSHRPIEAIETIQPTHRPGRRCQKTGSKPTCE